MRERSLRVLVLANLPPHVLGGAENQSARLAGAWAELGARVEVAGHRIPTGSQLLGRHQIATSRIATLDSAGRAGRALSYFASLGWLLVRRQRHFDVIYARGLSDAALTVCALRALRIVRLPIVSCPINAGGAGEANLLRSLPFSKLWIRIIDSECSAVNSISMAIAEDMNKIGVRTPIASSIPNGVEVKPLHRAPRRPGPRRLVWTGRLGPQKGLDLLLPALAIAAQHGFDFHAELIGDGPSRSSLVAQAGELGLSDRLSFIASLPEQQIRDRLRQADVFMLPSRYEGMSNSALEAMEVGLPCLLTRCGGIDVHVDSGMGWVCAAESIEALTSAVLAMLATDDAKLEAMGATARSKVEQCFDMREVARRNLDLLATVATSAH